MSPCHARSPCHRDTTTVVVITTARGHLRGILKVILKVIVITDASHYATHNAPRVLLNTPVFMCVCVCVCMGAGSCVCVCVCIIDIKKVITFFTQMVCICIYYTIDIKKTYFISMVYTCTCMRIRFRVRINLRVRDFGMKRYKQSSSV